MLPHMMLRVNNYYLKIIFLIVFGTKKPRRCEAPMKANGLFVTATHAAYLDNGTAIGLTVGFFNLQ